MSSPKSGYKLFGMALDLSDDPWDLELKQAWMSRPDPQIEGITACMDPYDAVTVYLKSVLQERHIEPSGKFPVPSWLSPKPEESDFPLVNAPNFGRFYDTGGLTGMVQHLSEWVEQKIFPGKPVMVGVDHTATMGVISALTGKYGTDSLSVIVLDQHFDALPLSVRVAGASGAVTGPMGGVPLSSLAVPEGNPDYCSCGNFWSYLLEEGRIKPENLAFIGVADYPVNKSDPASPFSQHYLEFEKRGCRFFPLEKFAGQYRAPLRAFIEQTVRTPNVYISFDLDVGSYNFTCAARYMDKPGISARDLLDIASQIQQTCRDNNVNLAGFDIMEFNMHFLGLETDGGVKDTTLAAVGDFIRILAAE